MINEMDYYHPDRKKEICGRCGRDVTNERHYHGDKEFNEKLCKKCWDELGDMYADFGKLDYPKEYKIKKFDSTNLKRS